MSNSIALYFEQLNAMKRNAEEQSYALQSIFKRALQKVSLSGINSFYVSDYNDCHGDYYDSEYN